MLQEPAEKLRGGERHRPLPIALGVVFIAERDLAVCDVQQPVVRDRHAVRVACQVFQYRLGAAERRPGIHDPFGPYGPVEKTLEALGIGDGRQPSGEFQFPRDIRLLEQVQKLAAKQPAEYAHGQEEIGPARDPACAVGRQSAGRDHAMQVGMRHQGLSPGMQYGQEPDFRPQVPGIGGDFQQRLAGRAEQHPVHQPRVGKRQIHQQVRQREHHVEIGHGQ